MFSKTRGNQVRSLCVLLAVFIGIAASTATGARSTIGQQKTIYFVTYTMTIPFFQNLAAGIKAEGKRHGFKVVVSAANFDAAQEATLVQTAITQRADAIALAPIDRQALVPAAAQAKAAGIPVVLVGDDFGAESQDKKLTLVGQNIQDYGRMKARFIAKRLPGGKGTVIVIHGPRGLDLVEAQKVGYQQVFYEYPGIKVIEGPYGNLSSEVGLKAMQNMLTRVPHPDAVFFDNDDLAIGGIQALRSAGVSAQEVITIGGDGSPAAIAAIRKGTLTASLASRPYAQGVKTVQVLKTYFATRKAPPKLVKVPAVILTKDNLRTLRPSAYR